MQLREQSSINSGLAPNMSDSNIPPARMRSKSKSAFGTLKVASRRYDVRPPSREASTDLRESLVTAQDVSIGKAAGMPGTLQGWEVRGGRARGAGRARGRMDGWLRFATCRVS